MWDEMKWSKTANLFHFDPTKTKIELNGNSWRELFGIDYDASPVNSMAGDVIKYFEDTGIKKVHNASRLLRIMILPSFEYQLRKCYELYLGMQTKEEGDFYHFYRQYAVLRLTWNEWQDMTRLQKKEHEGHIYPNVVHDFRLIESKNAVSILDGFEAAKIPSWSLDLALEDFAGEDGKTFHIWFGDEDWRSVKYSWWEEAPKAWAELDKATHEAISHIDKLLEE